jgi:hypothetical protein
MTNTWEKTTDALLEQMGDRRRMPAAGPGRLDLVSSTFACLQGELQTQEKLDQWIRESFPPYAEHPNLPGMYLLPGQVDGVASWSGVGRIRATFIGSLDFPNLPDAWIEAVDGRQQQLAAEGLRTLTLNYDVVYVQSIHYGLQEPENSQLVNRLVKLKGHDFSNTLAVFRNEVLERHGPYKICRTAFNPLVMAALTFQASIVGDKVKGATLISNALSGIAPGISPDNQTPEALEANAVQRTVRTIALEGCNIDDTFFRRLSRV